MRPEEYHNKQLTDACYENRLKKIKEVCPNGKVSNIKKKINTLRGGFRK